jgi:phosphoglycolate phosphatase
MVGLLTGNIEGGARTKLRPTGLLRHFEVGAYGSDDSDRRRLPAVARARAEGVTGQALLFRHVVIVGDTPLDVDCARACGAISVAVATGQHSLEDLRACAPDILFQDFSDVPAVLESLAGMESQGPDRACRT